MVKWYTAKYLVIDVRVKCVGAVMMCVVRMGGRGRAGWLRLRGAARIRSLHHRLARRRSLTPSHTCQQDITK